jgi:hypothetical protein
LINFARVDGREYIAQATDDLGGEGHAA